MKPQKYPILEARRKIKKKREIAEGEGKQKQCGIELI
jgi:hypothetical protein